MSRKISAFFVCALTILSPWLAYPEELPVPGQTKRCPGTKRGLVVSGGGVRGSYQVGALWYLVHVLGCDFSHFIGTSTGAITAAFLSQARSLDELKELTDNLVAFYKELNVSSDLVQRRSLNRLRILLPSWLGGIDGMVQFSPLETRLLSELNPRRVQTERIRIPVVSLQSGRIYAEWQRPDSVTDLVIGSASIPLVVEPRRARIWVRAEPVSLEGELLTLAVNEGGIADEKCEIRLTRSWVRSCQQMKYVIDPRRHPSIFVSLRLPGLSAEEGERLSELVAELKRTPGGEFPFEFTTYHQLIDGGVTDFLPIQDALDVEESLDFLFVLTSGETVRAAAPDKEFRGGLTIAERAFELLWDSYQSKAFWFDVQNIMGRNTICEGAEWMHAVVAWRETWLREMENAGKGTVIETLVRSGAARFPAGLPRAFRDSDLKGLKCSRGRVRVLLLEPEMRLFEHALDVDRRKLRQALNHGCNVAATMFEGPLEEMGGVTRGAAHPYVRDLACEALGA